MTKTFKEVIAGIRTAIYGREVREDIAQMGEYVEQFAQTAINKAAAALQSARDALASATAAKTSETNAASSQKAAASSAAAAATSANNAKNSETNAGKSAAAAAASASAAKTSETNSKTSETNTKTSETNAKASETNAGKSASAAASSQSAAAGSASAAKTSEGNAASSASAAKTSETNAAASAKAASASQTAAATSERNAAASEKNAGSSATKAASSQSAAADSAAAAKASEDNASQSAASAASSVTAAGQSETAAKSAAETATAKAEAAASSESRVEATTKAAESAASAALESQKAAAASATSAKASETVSKEYLDQVKTITLGAQGWYETPDTLAKAVPIGENGWWAVVGSTDTIWVWDSDTSAWKDTFTATELGDYYTREQVDGKLAGKSDTGHTHLYAGSNTAGGKANSAKTADSVDWANVTGKPESYPPNAHKHTKAEITDFPTLGTAAAKNAGDFAAASHTHDDRYYTESEVNVKLGEKLHEETVTDARDLNTIKTTGVYHLKTTLYTNGPGIQNHATLFVDYTVGTPYQIYIPDSVNRAWRRNHNNSNDTWTAWTELQLTDTNTWRGIQNNLTSDSTTDSLSAAQGKALKNLVDGKAASGHTHNYAGSSSAGGAANNALKVNDGDVLYKSFGTDMLTNLCNGLGVSHSDHNFIAVIRTDNSVNGFPIYSTGIAVGRGDTQTYIVADYGSYNAYIGGGNSGKIGWYKQIAFTDHTHAWSVITGKPSVVRSVKYSDGTLSVDTDGAYTAYGIGTIAASGSNYVRFTDGTQICWGSMIVTPDASSSTYVTWHFPVAFANTDYSCAVLSNESFAGGGNPMVQGKGTGAYIFRAYCRASSGTSFDLIAVGRWK